MSVPATIAPTLGKLIPLLASNHDGEVVATARAIDRVLKSGGRDWHDLAALICLPMSELRHRNADWRRDARFCAGHAKRLTERELDFIGTLARYRENPTDKQLKWLHSITERLRGAA
jgi:hypothetical protein